MSDYNKQTPSSDGILIANRPHTDKILRDASVYPYWQASDAAIIYGYSKSHIYKLITMGMIECFHGVHSVYVSTSSLNEYQARVNS